MKGAEQGEFDPRRLWLLDADREWLATRSAVERLRFEEVLVMFRQSESFIREADMIACELLSSRPDLPVRTRYVLERWRRRQEERGSPHGVRNRLAQLLGRRWLAHGLRQVSGTRRSRWLNPIPAGLWRSISLAPALNALIEQSEPPATSRDPEPEGESLL